jgi:hypothetical protein
MWIVVGLAAVAAVVAGVSSWQKRDQRSELGVVSHQWIAEHRFGQGNDSRR